MNSLAQNSAAGIERLLGDSGVMEVFRHLIGIGDDRATYDTVEIHIRAGISGTVWIGIPAAHLVAGKDVDFVGCRALLIRDPVHV